MIEMADAQAIAARIAEAVHPEKIVLFGSLAAGQSGPDSDVDLFVIWDPPEKLTMRERRIKLRRIVGITDVPVDILTCRRYELQAAMAEPHSFTAQIMETGVTLYG